MERRHQGRAVTWGAKPERPTQEGPGAEKRQRWRRWGEGRSPRGAGASPVRTTTPPRPAPLRPNSPSASFIQPGSLVETAAKGWKCAWKRKKGKTVPGPLSWKQQNHYQGPLPSSLPPPPFLSHLKPQLQRQRLLEASAKPTFCGDCASRVSRALLLCF